MTTTSTNSFLAHLRISLVATVVLGVLLAGAYPLIVWGAAQLLFPAQANGSLVSKDGKVVGSALIGQNFSDPKYFHPRPSAAGAGYDATSSGGSNLGPTSAKLMNGTTRVPAPRTPPADVQAARAGSAPVAAATAAASAPRPAPVVDFDGIALRVLHFCDDNGIPFAAFQDGEETDLAPYRTKSGWDEVKLVTAFNDRAHPLSIKAGRLIPADAVTASASGLDPHISVADALLQVPRVAKARGVEQARVRTLVERATAGAGLGLLGDPGVNVLRLNLALDAAR